MRIVHLLPYFDPTSKGGTESFIRMLAFEQKADGHTVTVLCPNIEESVSRLVIDGLDYVAFPYPYRNQDRKFLSGLYPHPTCDGFERILSALAPDILHLHGLFPPLIPYIERARLGCKAALLLTVHMKNILCSRHTLIDYRGTACDGLASFARCVNCTAHVSGSAAKTMAGQAILPLSIHLTHSVASRRLLTYVPAHSRVEARIRALDFIRGHMAVDVLTPHMKESFLRNGFDESRVSYFRNPQFDRRSFEPQLGAVSRHESIRFVVVGRVSAEKGIGLLLDAIGHLQDLKDRFSIAFAGKCIDVGLTSRIKAMAGSGYKLTLLGELDAENVKKLYRESDYLLSTSLPGMEMLPLVIQEALEQGLPVIASDTLGSQALVHDGANGWLFHGGDACDLAGKLRNAATGGTVLKFQYRPDRAPNVTRKRYYADLYERLVAGVRSAAVREAACIS